MPRHHTPIGTIETLESGHGDSLFVLLHASAAGPASLAELSRALLRPGRRIVAPALQGYGVTDVDVPDPLDAHIAIANWAIARRGVGPVTVFGHSMGGLIALLAAAGSEDCDHVLAYDPIAPGGLDPTDPADADVLAWDRAIVARLRASVARSDPEPGVAAFVEAWNEVRWPKLPASARQGLLEASERLAAETAAVSHRDIGELTRLRSGCEVSLVLGQRSPAMVARMASGIVARVPHARRRFLAGRGHMGPVTHAQELVEVLESLIGG